MNNTSYNDILLDKLSEERLKLLIPNTCIVIFFLLLSTAGNTSVLYVYASQIKSISDNRYFIPRLAFLDMASCVNGATMYLILNLHPFTYRNDVVCKMLWTSGTMCSVSSALMLVSIAVQRFLKVCRPFREPLTIRTMRLMILAVVAGSIIAASPCLYLYGETEIKLTYNQTIVTGYKCDKTRKANKVLATGYSGFLLILGVSGISTLIGLYAAIFKTISKQETFKKTITPSQMQQSNNTKGNSKSNSQEGNDKKNITTFLYSNSAVNTSTSEAVCDCSKATENEAEGSTRLEDGTKSKRELKHSFRKHKISLMFMIITTTTTISYIPRLALMIAEGVNEGLWETLSDKEFLIFICFYRLYLLNNVISPIIYYIFDTDFRNGFKHVCRRMKKIHGFQAITNG